MRQPRIVDRQPGDVLDALSPAPSLSPRSLEEQLATLTLQAGIAEATARIVAAEQSAALGRRATTEHLLATEDLEAALSRRSRSTSPTGSLAAPPLVGPADGSELARLVISLDERHRADLRAAEAREERYHRAAEARDIEYRAERAASDARFAALLTNDRRPATRHIIGTALRDACPAFEGQPGQDVSEWLAEFLRLSSAHEIPPAFLSNELIIKLKGNAARWFQTAFPDASDACPPWADLQGALLHYFTRRYTAAGAYIALHGARRLPGSTGPEAVQRVAELVLALSLKGVPLAAGPNEQLAYVYQNQLSEEEFSRWSAAANAHHAVSDAALATLESTAAADRGTTSRLSCSGATREHWFQGRAEHLRSFLMDQARAPGGGGTPARAAVVAADGTADGPVVTVVGPVPTAAGAAGHRSVPGGASTDLLECRLRVARADLIAAAQGHQQPRGKALPPPEYYGANPQHQDANSAEFRGRREKDECFACTMSDIQRGLHFLSCSRHGTGATWKSREDPLRRVKGAALPGKTF